MGLKLRVTSFLLGILIPSLAVLGDYCTTSLARKTCPDLATFDSLDLDQYVGKWYEIGCSATFKNTFEAGGTCTVASYSKGKESKNLKVENSVLLSARVGTIVSVAGISASSSLVCQSSRAICKQVRNSESLLREGISKVWKVKSSIESEYSSEASSISLANGKIEAAADAIAPKLDALTKHVSDVQTANSILSQTDATADKSTVVASLKAAVGLALEQAKAVDASFDVMKDSQLDLIKVAETLFKKGGSGIIPSFKLTDAATEVLAGITTIKTELTAVTVALEASSKVAGLVIEDKTKAYFNVSKASGQGVQDSKDAGKFVVSFDPLSEKLKAGGKYWVLAVDSSAGKYNAALIYSCSELLGGGIDETVWVLSRTPSIGSATVSSFVSKLSALGIDQSCDSPFVLTVRSSKCTS